MDKELKMKLCKVLKEEFDNVKQDENDTKIQKLWDIHHLMQIIERFEELEPVIADYINRKAEKDRFDR